MTDRPSRKETSLPLPIRGYKQSEKPKIRLARNQKSVDLRAHRSQISLPIRILDSKSFKGSPRETIPTLKVLSYSRTILSLKAEQKSKDEILPLTTSQNLRKSEDFDIGLSQARETKTNTIYSTRTRPLSIGSFLPQVDSLRTTLDKSNFSTMFMNQQQSEGTCLEEPKFVLRITRDASSEKAFNTPPKIRRTVHITSAPTSYENSPFAEFKELGVRKYTGIHKGTLGKTRLIEHDCLDSNQESPLTSQRGSKLLGFQPTVFDTIQKSVVKSARTVKFEDKLPDSWIGSSNEIDNLSQEARDEVELDLPEKTKPRSGFVYKRQLSTQTYLFNKARMFGNQNDEKEGELDDKRELAGRINSHLFLSDLLKKRKVKIENSQLKALPKKSLYQ